MLELGEAGDPIEEVGGYTMFDIFMADVTAAGFRNVVLVLLWDPMAMTSQHRSTTMATPWESRHFYGRS